MRLHELDSLDLKNDQIFNMIKLSWASLDQKYCYSDNL